MATPTSVKLSTSWIDLFWHSTKTSLPAMSFASSTKTSGSKPKFDCESMKDHNFLGPNIGPIDSVNDLAIEVTKLIAYKEV